MRSDHSQGACQFHLSQSLSVGMLVGGIPKRKEQIINSIYIGSKCDSLLAHKGKIYKQVFL